jgi:hypothetical protein
MLSSIVEEHMTLRQSPLAESKPDARGRATDENAYKILVGKVTGRRQGRRALLLSGPGIPVCITRGIPDFHHTTTLGEGHLR